MSVFDDIQNFGDEPKKKPTTSNNGGGGNGNDFYSKEKGSAWVNNQENDAPANTPTPTPTTIPQTQTATAKVENPTPAKVDTPTQTPTTNNGATTTQNNGDDEEIGDNDFLAELRKKQTELGNNDNPAPTKVDETKTISAVQKQAQESATKARNFENMIAQIYDAEMKRNAVDYDPEKEKKERKRQKRNELFAAIGDGISALANMWGTYHGAKDMYDPKNSMSDRVRKRYEKLKAEKEKKRQNYLNAASGKYQILKGRESTDAASAAAETNANIAAAKRKQDAEQFAEKMGIERGKLGAQLAGVQAKINSTNQSHDLDVQKLAETKRHNGVMEHNATVRENRLANGGSGSNKDTYEIRLGDGKSYSYNKKKIGSLIGLLPEMKRKAAAAAKYYADHGDNENAETYEQMVTDLNSARSTDAMHSAVVANLWDFPTMQEKAKKILGVAYDPQKPLFKKQK